MAIWSRIPKFGLGHSDLPTLLWNVTFLMRALLLNIDSRHKKHISVFVYISFAVATCCFTHVFLVSTAWFVLVRSQHDDPHRIVVLSLALSSNISVVKLFFIYMNNSAIKRLLNNYLSCDALVEPGSRLSRNIIKNMRIVKKRALFPWIFIVLNCVVYIIKPLLMPGRHAIDEKFPLYGLEPTLESPNYELYFVTMSIACMFTVYLSMNISFLVTIIAGYIESQMLSLSTEVREMWNDAEAEYNNDERGQSLNNKSVYKTLMFVTN